MKMIYNVYRDIDGDDVKVGEIELGDRKVSIPDNVGGADVFKVVEHRSSIVKKLKGIKAIPARMDTGKLNFSDQFMQLGGMMYISDRKGFNLTLMPKRR